MSLPLRTTPLRATPFLLLCACAGARPLPPASPASEAHPVAPPPSVLPATPPPRVSSTEAAAPVDPRLARLARLARIWGDVQYLDPYLWEDRPGIDWNAALATALPKVSDARSDDEEAAAVEEMLGALHDPITRVEPEEHPTPEPSKGDIGTTWGSPDALVVKIVTHRWGEVGEHAKELKKEIARAKSLVIDLRATGNEMNWLSARGVDDELAGAIASHDCAEPASRSVLHSGYRPQVGESSGGYSTSFVSETPRFFPAAIGPHPARVVFLVNEHSAIPGLALAMQRAGDAQIVAQGGMVDPIAASRADDPVGKGRVALFRTIEIDAPVAPDLVLPSSPEIERGAALDAALKLATKGWNRHPASARSTLPAARWRPDPTWPDESYPPLPHRLLALFRFWNVIRLFYPYMPLLEPGAWDRALTDFIPRLEQAKDARDYALTLAELATRVPDSHVYVDSPQVSDFFGRSLYGVTIRHVEGEPVVLALSEARKDSGLHVGDVIESVDGAPFETRAARVARYIAASNAWALARNADERATGGPIDSEAVLVVRGADDKPREVRVKRTPWVKPAKPTPHYKTIDDGGVGYVDLSALTPDEVDPMFAALAKTRAIVFDMRGYPNGTAWPIAPHLNVNHALAGPRFSRMLVGGGEPRDVEQPRYLFVQGLPQDPAIVPYTGKTVMLINEETQSQAEHTGLFFEAANGTKFIGSPTAGANGDVTYTCLPGNICISFTGHDVRHADGRQLQRVGLQPDVEVRPTIAGLRAGRDEVLERALVYLREGR